MAESRTSRFLRFLSRIRSTRPLAEADVESVSHLAVNNNEERVPEVIHYENQKEEMDKFMRWGFRTYTTTDAGLAALGWKELPAGGGPEITPGAVAAISLAYKLSDRRLPLESRHLSVAKIQGLSHAHGLEAYDRVWTEVEVLRGLVHENIVGFYGMFAVDPHMETDHDGNYKRDSRFPDHRILWTLLEYASAGDLVKEVKRYEIKSIPESGVRYYMLQMCRGLEHLHDKRIIHYDLHPGNVLLKYKPDGTKVCMICDFGLAHIMRPDEPIGQHTFQPDISSVRRLAVYMMQNISRSPEAKEMISGRLPGHKHPSKIAEFLAFPWFNGPVHAPIPKEPTPLLQPEVVEQIGYLPPLDAAGTTSPSPAKHVVHSPHDEIEEVSGSDSHGGTFAHRMRERLRSIPHHVRTRIRSLPCVGGRAARRESEPEIELQELPSRRRREH